MPRRKALTREQRERRAGKKAARAESAPLRQIKRAMARVAAPTRLQTPLDRARDLYDFACQAAHMDDLVELLVCERCGLVQSNHDRGGFDERGLVTVGTCKGFEEIGCGSLHAVTVESFERHVQHVTI